MSFCSYSINEDDVIYCTSGMWTEISVENGGSKDVAQDVVGTELWDHIQGLEIKSYLNAVFYAVRTSRHSIVLPYRCDTPIQPMLFSMTVALEQDGCLRVDHKAKPKLVDVRPSKNVVEVSQTGSQLKCSVCCAFKVGKEWLDPFVQPSVLDFPKGLGVCPTCKRKAAVATSEALRMDGGKLESWPRS